MGEFYDILEKTYLGRSRRQFRLPPIPQKRLKKELIHMIGMGTIINTAVIAAPWARSRLQWDIKIYTIFPARSNAEWECHLPSLSKRQKNIKSRRA